MGSEFRTDPKGRALPTGIRYRAGRYQVRVTFQRQQLSIGSYDTLTIAKAALERARGQIALGTFVTPDKRAQLAQATREKDRRDATTVEQYVATWLDVLHSEGRSDGTVRSYRSTLSRHVLPAVGGKRLIDVTVEDINRIDRQLAAWPGARYNAARTMSSMFRRAVADGLLAESPVRVKAMKKKHDPRDLSRLAAPGEVAALAAMMPPQLKAAVLLAAWCALRKGEVLGLQRRDLTAADGSPMRAGVPCVVRVVRQWNSKTRGHERYTGTKENSSRIVSVPPELVPVLVDHLDTWTAEAADAPVFASTWHGLKPCSHTSLDDAWSAARDQVKPGLVFHALRHTGLTEFAQAGGTEAEVMARAGHRNREVAALYQHATRERDQRLAERMGTEIRL